MTFRCVAAAVLLGEVSRSLNLTIDWMIGNRSTGRMTRHDDDSEFPYLGSAVRLKYPDGQDKLLAARPNGRPAWHSHNRSAALRWLREEEARQGVSWLKRPRGLPRWPAVRCPDEFKGFEVVTSLVL